MTPRERVLRTLRFDEPDKVPVLLAYETMEGICRKYGKEDFIGRLRENDIRRVGLEEGKPSPLVRERYLPPDLSPEAQIDQWGVARLRKSGWESFKEIHPLTNIIKASDLDDYPFPDLMKPELYAHLDKEILDVKNAGYAVEGSVGWLFELAWGLRGMQNLMMDFHINPELAEKLLNIIAEKRMDVIRLMVKAGVDILRFGDDVGSQHGMLISPETWRRFLKPHMAKSFDIAKEINPDIFINYHSDGDIREIIPDLLEIGLNILNPVQPECMDPVELKKQYGDRLAFQGTIGTQTIMPYGSVQEVKNAVAKMCREVGKGGGLIIGPTHTLQPEVPWENIVAFYEAVEEFGVYRGR